MTTEPRRLRVHAASGAYDVLVGPALLPRAAELALAALPSRPAKMHIVADTGVPEPLRAAVEASLRGSGIDTAVSLVYPTETDKSIATWARLLHDVAARRLDRGDALLALGGGIVGDITGFVAAAYRRGIAVVQCPTTLLSMVDAAVGGKTGVNLPVTSRGVEVLTKNTVGAFHQPVLVLADLHALDSLPPRVFASGLAECVKHGMLSRAFGDPDLFAWLEARVDLIRGRDAGTLGELVARCIAVKARVVEGDERETAPTAGRALLNLGHTFAHAIETLPNLSPTDDPADAPLMHGEAVALGLVAATAAATAAGTLQGPLLARVSNILQANGLPTRARGLPDDDTLLDRMGHDKKADAGRLRFILPDGEGSARIVHADALGPTLAPIRAGLAAIRRDAP